MTSIFLGIDLGTSHSTVAYVTDDPRYANAPIVPVHVIELSFDEHEATRSPRMPSIVSRTLDDRRVRRPLIGWDFVRAFWQRRRSARLLRHGHDFFRSVKADMGSYRVYPHAFSGDLNTPAKVSAAIIGSLLKAAEQKLGPDARRARVTMTVPASFSTLGRQDTLLSAELAELAREQVELIDEPVAALLDLLNDPRAATILSADVLRTLLVFDYGGGTCDLALLQAKFDQSSHTGLHVENLAISEYRRLGGDDIDRAVMETVLWPQICERERLTPSRQRHVEDTFTVTVARRLKEALCRKVAERVSRDGWRSLQAKPVVIDVAAERIFDLPEVNQRTPSRFKITSADFERVMGPFLQVPDGDARRMRDRFPHSLLVPIFQILDKAGRGLEAVDVLVLHGGGCRNPYVQQGLRHALSPLGGPALQIVETPDLDASIAQGAALACYWKHARGQQLVRPIMAEDLGIIGRNERPVCLVRAGTPLPYPADGGVTAVEDEWYVSRDEQPELLLPLYTRSPDRLAGSVKVSLPPRVPQGAAVRMKLAVDASKQLRWWFSIQGGEYLEAPAINDPWTSELPSPELRRLIEHRRGMQQAVETGTAILPKAEYKEAFLLYEAHVLDGALDAISGYLDRNPEAPRGHNLQGLILGQLGRHQEAVKAYTRAAELDPKEPVYRGNIGCALSRAGQPRDAVPVIREALSANPELTYLYEWLGDVYRGLREEEPAAAEYRRGLTLAITETGRFPDSRRAWEQRARLHHKLGDYDQGDVAKRRAMEIRLDERYGGDADDMMTVL
jgi:molecular chaperone DnaK